MDALSLRPVKHVCEALSNQAARRLKFREDLVHSALFTYSQLFIECLLQFGELQRQKHKLGLVFLDQY